MKATHKGWFLFCPIYVDMHTTPEAPHVWARLSWLEPLLSAAHFVQASMIGFLSMANPDYEPAFMLRITGEM